MEQVEDAERRLAVRLPESYRAFLSEFGWGRFADDEIYGLGSDVPSHLDLVRNAVAEQTVMEPLMPHGLVPVMNDGAGNHYCLNTRSFCGNECPVVFWDHELAQDEFISPSFDLWLITRLDRLVMTRGR